MSATDPLETTKTSFDGYPRLQTSLACCDPGSVTLPGDGLGKPISSCDETSAAIRRAGQLLKSDSLVAFPTETVYGLGACATSSSAVSKIFAAKGRPSDNPLIVHISSLEHLKAFLPPDWQFPRIYEVLTKKFWPGPLTILLPTTSAAQPKSKISDLVTCGLTTVAVRMPNHPLARAIIFESGLPIAAPSANISGRPSPTRANHVMRDLDGRLELILDGGSCNVGLESTVVDGLNPDGKLRILRHGGSSEEDIKLCLKDAGLQDSDESDLVIDSYHSVVEKPQTPGMKYKHYSPSAKVIILDPLTTLNSSDPDGGHVPGVADLVSELLNKDSADGGKYRVGLMLLEDGALREEFERVSHNIESDRFSFSYCDLGVASKPEISAQKLFYSLRYLDEEMGVDIIFTEKVNKRGLGQAVMERLIKASNKNPYQQVKLY